jgi:hypothetical protein
MVSQKLAGKNFSGSGYGLIELVSCKFPREPLENHEKPQSGKLA